MLEKRLGAVSPQVFTANGGTNGVITIADTSPFRVKQEVFLSATSLPSLNDIEVKVVLSSTQLAVGPKSGNINARTDVSAYTTSLGAFIAANEQKRPSIPFEEFTRATYEEEPVVATRVVPVDQLGNIRNQDNPLPIKANTWWNEANITRDGDDDITKIEFEKNDVLVETIDLEYNGEKSVIKVIKS